MCDWIPDCCSPVWTAALAAEGAPRHLRTRRRRVALPLAWAHQAQHAVDGGCVEAGGNDLVAGLVLVYVAQQDPVEHVVGWQRVLVELVLAQLRRRRPRDHRRRDHRRAGHRVAPLRHREYLGLVPVLDRSEQHTSELKSLMRTSYDVLCLKHTK